MILKLSFKRIKYFINSKIHINISYLETVLLLKEQLNHIIFRFVLNSIIANY